MLRAGEQYDIAMAVRIAGLALDDWNRAMRNLERLAQPDVPVPLTPVRAKHAAWFEREGIPHLIITDETIH